MFPIHLDQMMRMCGAQTQVIGQQTFNVNNKLAAVAGDIDSHMMLGQLIPMSGGSFMINNKPAIVAMKDMSAPDIMGMIPHMQGLPIPMQGSPNFFIGSGSGGGGGSAGVGMGMMSQMMGGGFGGLQIGELVSVGQQVMGMVQNFTQTGGGSGIAQLSNMQGNPITPGTTVTGQTSNNSFTFMNYFDSRVATGANSYPSIDTVKSGALSSPTGEYIVIDDYYRYPDMNLTASVITI